MSAVAADQLQFLTAPLIEAARRHLAYADHLSWVCRGGRRGSWAANREGLSARGYERSRNKKRPRGNRS